MAATVQEFARPAVGERVRCQPNRVLLVDDEPAIRHVFATVLTDEWPACEVDAAADGLEALGLFRERHHAVVVMDIRMPIMDGERAFHEIRTWCDARAWEVPSVVFCTGYVLPESLRAYVGAGSLHDVLLKPLTCGALLEAVGRRLGRAGGPASAPPLPRGP